MTRRLALDPRVCEKVSMLDGRHVGMRAEPLADDVLAVGLEDREALQHYSIIANATTERSNVTELVSPWAQDRPREG